jgi:tRNA U55 pseudouridine synthase TruB
MRSVPRACNVAPTLITGANMLGFVNVFKPAGPTSTQVGARVRKMFQAPGGPKLPVGHLGTLDPMAAGVLPLALGKATRLIPLIEDRRKSYTRRRRAMPRARRS